MGKHAFLSLGSNLGDRVGVIRSALEKLPHHGIEVLRVSSFYRSEPVEFEAQPWFVNCVAEVGTDLMPLQLLRKLQSVERGLGRRRGVRKGPRRIDIDILLYENVVVHMPALTIPHAGLADRKFALVPLRELAPNLRHPVSQRTVLEMFESTKDAGHLFRLKEP
jgi:2-amino-4-hydroxy-6-hydroxymethyldihydropteridine diphosphokinase